jgi:hypothetical protein
VSLIAARIVADRPTYWLFENNCQNFVKFLLEALCPGDPIPETIQDILQRLQNISTVAEAHRNVLPGAYPAAAPEVVPDNPAPRRPHPQRRLSHYTHIFYPKFSQVLLAALIWDEIAEREGLEYAFVGSFALRAQ